MIEIGGDTGKGLSPRGRRVAVQVDAPVGGVLTAVSEYCSLAQKIWRVATSGNYRNLRYDAKG